MGASNIPIDWGNRLRALREAQGLSRRELASRLKVDVTSISGWEAGKHVPRVTVRTALSKLLGTEVMRLGNRADTGATDAVLVDAEKELPDLLVELTKNARHIRVLRLASPYFTRSNHMAEWRKQLQESIDEATIQVETVEIFYDLRRLREVFSNIIRYDRSRYTVKSYCPGISEVIPALGAYIFDDREFLLYGYWRNWLPKGQSAVRISGPIFELFFRRYWDEAWAGGRSLNPHGTRHVNAIQQVAFQLGLAADGWNEFEEEARSLDIGDGCPPII